MKSISPCLWFNNQAVDAASYYAAIFENVRFLKTAQYSKTGAEATGQKEGSVMTMSFQLENIEVLGLNGGPAFAFTPALSFFLHCESEVEIEEKWQKLAQDGQIRMTLGEYPWAQKYGWTADRFGFEWQLIIAPFRSKITPSFLFVDQLFGKGEEAIQFYTSIFPDSKIDSMVRDEETNTVRHSAFQLNGQDFTLMEGKGEHNFAFNEAVSLVVYCEDQMEVDQYWEKLLVGGSAGRCGWLKDKFGVSWQIVPIALTDLLADSASAEKTMQAMLQMSKLDIASLIAEPSTNK